MATILCRNNGYQHTHSSVTESKVCYGIITYPSAPAPAPLVEPATARQVAYVSDLKGDAKYASKLSKRECSQYITDLMSGKAAKVTAPAEEVVPEEVAPTTKSDMVKGLIEMVPDGYFAVREYDGGPISFLRVSRPKGGNFRNALKISSQHGPALEPRWVKWPSGQISVYRWAGHDIENDLLLLIADWKGATRLYAEKAKKCGRCNTKLTDPRSRFYLIGPECEKHWEWWLADVAAEKGGYWEQQPLSVQEKYLPDFADAREL